MTAEVVVEVDLAARLAAGEQFLDVVAAPARAVAEGVRVFAGMLFADGPEDC